MDRTFVCVDSKGTVSDPMPNQGYAVSLAEHKCWTACEVVPIATLQAQHAERYGVHQLVAYQEIAHPTTDPEDLRRKRRLMDGDIERLGRELQQACAMRALYGHEEISNG